MTGQQLKNSILQEAIKGRLVPQDPNDEPASVLLERIRAEKARLVKEKKIKKDKNESRIYRTDDGHWMEHFEDKSREDVCIDEEIPFEVPSGWEWCRLGNIIDFSKSNSVKPNTIQDNDWVLDLEDIEKDSGRLLRRKTKLELDVKSDKHLFHKGNVLYSKLRPYLNKVIIAKEDGYCTSEILAFDFKEIYNKYAQSFFMSKYFVDYAMKDAYGVKMPRLGSKQGNLTLFPLPPLAEQHRIVEKIESLLPKVEAYGKAQEELVKLTEALPDQLKKSILQEAIEGRLVPQDPNDEPASVLLKRIRAEKARLVKEKKIKKTALNEKNVTGEEKIFDVPDTWEWCKIETIFQHSSGKQLKGGDTKGSLHQYITTSNLYWDRFVLDNLKSMYYKDSELDRCTAQKGDLLVCEGGDVGRSAIWPYDYNICLQNHVHRLRPYLDGYTRYVFYVIWLYKSIGLIGGKGIGIKGFSASALKDFSIPLPPLAEQHRIVEKIESLLPKIEKLKVNK